MPTTLRDSLLYEVLRDSHQYAPGVDHESPAEIEPLAIPWRRRVDLARQRASDAIERAARRAGFNRRHFAPDRAAQRLGTLLDRMGDLERTYAALDDEHSRRTLVELLKLRTLGPRHVRLPVAAAEFRARQGELDRRFRVDGDDLEVSDPWFSRLHLYELERPDGGVLRLYSHSVALMNVFVMEQYAYANEGVRVSARPGDVVIDAGGCWGDSALYLAERVGPEGRVYTFEFTPDSLAVLRRNLELNPALAERVTVVEAALWHQSGVQLSFVPAGQTTRVADNGGGKAHSVTTISLDDFVDQQGIERVGFLKMDVEGAEPSVLRGAARSLREHSPRFAIAAYHRDSDLAEIPTMVSELQPAYRLYLDHFSAGEDETVLFGAAG